MPASPSTTRLLNARPLNSGRGTRMVTRAAFLVLWAARTTAPLTADAVNAGNDHGAPQATAPHLSQDAIFGESRRPDADLLILRDGRRLLGDLTPSTWTLRTVFGAVSLDSTVVAGIQFAGPTEPLATVWCVNQDRFSGVLDPLALQVRVTNDRAWSVPSPAASRLVRRTVPGEADRLAQHHFLVLRNGDRFSARLAGTHFTVAVDATSRTIPLSSLNAIHFSADHPPKVRFELCDGASFVASSPTDELEMTLAVGSTVRLYPDWILAIYCGAGSRPTDPRPAASIAADTNQSPPGLVWLRPGRFVMGSPGEETGRDFDESPLTEVTLTHAFWMGAREVTQAEFKAVTGANPSQFVGDPERPVERVNWREAVAYCEELTRRWAAAGRLPPGHAFRLPTEAEWEYACRAGSTSRFSHGEDPDARRLGEFAWFGDNSDASTHPVGTRQPNAWGLYDLHGNVLEWCLDYAAAYPGGSVTNHMNLAGGGLLRIARGGSWLYGANAARSANRDTYTEATRCSDLGFRVVLAPVTEGSP